MLLISSEAARSAAEISVRSLKTGKAVLNSLIESGVAVDSEPVLQAILEWCCIDSRPGKARYSDLEKVLRYSLQSERIQVAERALDEMEGLARQDICPQRYVELLSDQENYDPAWTSSDSAWSAVSILERLGRYREASLLLRHEFHACLSQGDSASTLEAGDILEQIKSYGLDDVELDDLASRLKAVRDREAEPNGRSYPDAPVCITVVGGDEQQARYDDCLRNTFQNDVGKLELHFRHTNWSSNHGEQFDQMRPLLDRSDAVVVIRRIRTNLGRNVRRYAPLWIGCGGDSKSSIERAIRKALSVVRSRKSLVLHEAR